MTDVFTYDSDADWSVSGSLKMVAEVRQILFTINYGILTMLYVFLRYLSLGIARNINQDCSHTSTALKY